MERELLDSITEEDEKALHDHCKELGLTGWRKWVAENHGQINAILERTPERRVVIPEWNEPHLRRCLALAAIREVRLARGLMNVIQQFQIEPGGDSRMTVSMASLAIERFSTEFATEYYWCLNDDDPFGEKESLLDPQTPG